MQHHARTAHQPQGLNRSHRTLINRILLQDPDADFDPMVGIRNELNLAHPAHLLPIDHYRPGNINAARRLENRIESVLLGQDIAPCQKEAHPDEQGDDDNRHQANLPLLGHINLVSRTHPFKILNKTNSTSTIRRKYTPIHLSDRQIHTTAPLWITAPLSPAPYPPQCFSHPRTPR